MILRGWHIDGYGIFRDWTVTDLTSGLTVLHGPNEAGKSTLLSFLRGVLFGFPRGNGRIPALAGGLNGGRLFLEDDAGGLWTLERWVGKSGFTLTRPDGSAAEPSELAALLHHADGALFRSVFAFDLGDLQDWKSLADKNVRARFFSTGISGAGASAAQVLAALDREAEALYKPRGSNPDLNKVLDEIKGLEEQRKHLLAEAGEYPEKRLGRDAAADRVEELRAQRDTLARKVARLKLLTELRPVRERLADRERRLAQLPVPEGFPADASARWDAALEKRGEAACALDGINAELNALRHEIATLAADPALLAAASRAQELRAALPAREERRKALSAAEREAENRRARLGATLESLGNAWTEGRLRSLDAGVEQEEALRAWRARLENAVRELRAAQDARKLAENDLAVRVPAQEETDSGPSPGGRRRALATLRDLMAEAQPCEISLETAKELLARNEAELGRLHSHSGPPPVVSRLFQIAGILSAVAGAMVFLRSGTPRFLAFFLLFFGLFFAVIPWLISRLAMHRSKEVVREIEKDAEALRTDRLAFAADLSRLRERIGAEALAAGVADPSDPASLRRAEEEIERALETSRRREDAEEMRRRLSLCAEREAEAARARDRLGAEWAAEWARRFRADPAGFAPDPEGALNLLRRVESAKREIADRDEAEAKSAALRAEEEAWDAEARFFLSAFPEQREEEDLPSALHSLADQAGHAVENKTRSDEIVKKIEELEKSKGRLEASLLTAENALSDLLRRAGAIDGEGFRRICERDAERREIARQAEQDRMILESRIGNGPEAAGLAETLRSGDPEEERAALATGESDLRRLEAELDAANQTLGRLGGELEAIERSPALAECELELAPLLVRGADLASRWRILALARALLRRTLDAYTAERQPEVLARASLFFAECTAGRYPKVLQVPGDDEFKVLRADGLALAVDELSRGTREDLYVCLRLALAEQFARRSGRLPFVADDVFVNFDPGRAKAALGVLAEFARDNQAVLFTCHPETVERVRAVASNVRLINLGAS